MTAALDNDVVFKAGCYGVLHAVQGHFGSSIAVLGTARFVALRKIRRARLGRRVEEASSQITTFLDAADVLEPSDDETGFAAELEAAAQAATLALDTGESLLCAIVASRSGFTLHTGDKRAITAIDALVDIVEALRALAGAVYCLEQLVLALVERDASIHAAICRERDVDQALTFALGCYRPDLNADSAVEGLISYIEDVRRKAPRILGP